MSIERCTNSTLREAYTAVLGLPGPIASSEFPSLRTRFEQEWPGQFTSLRVLMPPSPPIDFDPEAALPPSWFGQLAWDGGRWVGRWGHRTLGLHRAIPDDDRYETFAETMRPTLEEWLKVASEAYRFADLRPDVATVVFGYINAFTFDVEESDLSEWFRFNFAIDAAGAAEGLSELAVGARISRPDVGARASVNLQARQEDSCIRVTVRTVAQRDLQADATFHDGVGLVEEIEHAKAVAKDTFFSFATPRTLELMGAIDAE